MPKHHTFQIIGEKMSTLICLSVILLATIGFMVRPAMSADGSDTSGKVWFITGSSSGFGLEFAKAALERGDNVAATARRPEQLSTLREKFDNIIITQRLDVTNRAEAQSAVNEAIAHFGRIDIVVSNAGYGHFGAVEEFSEEEFRQQLETNLFGSFNVIQATLPILRKQRSGHIIQNSSIGGVVGVPLVGAYNASKWGIEGLCAALAQEIAPLGIKVSLVEPGPFSTNFMNAKQWTQNRIDDYAALTHQFHERTTDANHYENPHYVAKVVLKLADSENPPLHTLVGTGTVELVKKVYTKKIRDWEEWGDGTGYDLDAAKD